VSSCNKRSFCRLISFALLIALLYVCIASAQTSAQLIKLIIGGHPIEVELAATPEARERGLMYRRSLPPGRGMLFVFPDAQKYCMWMKNTYIPLSVAFIKDRGTIVNIDDMQPGSLTYHCAEVLVRYVLEMPREWFSKNGIGPGARIMGLDKAHKMAEIREQFPAFL